MCPVSVTSQFLFKTKLNKWSQFPLCKQSQERTLTSFKVGQENRSPKSHNFPWLKKEANFCISNK